MIAKDFFKIILSTFIGELRTIPPPVETPTTVERVCIATKETNP